MIKRATIDDLINLVDLFDLYRVFYQKCSDKEGAAKFLSTRIIQDESVIFIAYEQEVAVGFTQLYPKYTSARMQKNWILNDLFVREAYRRKQYGEQLIKEVLSFARGHKASYVQLETQIGNLYAQKLYRKLDFEQQEPEQEFLTFKYTL